MNEYLTFLLIVALLVVLERSAKTIEDSFVFLAKKLKISEFLLGFTVLGVITSLPEIAIALSASNDEQARIISMGNLFGASIILMTFAMGFGILRFGELKFRGKFKESDVLLALVVISLSVLLCLDKELNVIDGIILTGGYILYILHFAFRRHKKEADKKKVMVSAKVVYFKLIKALIAILFLLLSASLILNYSVQLATKLGVSEAIIGLVLIAFGTSLPELTILFTSHNGKEKKLAEGNFIGSASINAGILGLLALSSSGFKFEDEFRNLLPIFILMTITIFLFGVFCWSGKKLTRNEGVFLILLYFCFLLVEAILPVSSHYNLG